jgi:ribosomal protein L29
VADLNKYLGTGGVNLKIKSQREQIREATSDELSGVLDEAQLELLNLRTQAILQQAGNPMRIRQVRKMVARIHGELGSRAAQGR